MKKLISLLLVLIMVVSVAAGCKSEDTNATTTTPTTPTTTAPAVQNLTGTMEEVITAIYEKHAALQLPLMSMTLDLTDLDTLGYNTGLTSAEKISQVAISEPMMGQPYSLILVRVKDAADANAIAKEMFEKVDTRKWVCMEADTKTAASYGDVAMFFMVKTDFKDQVTTATMMDAFKAVCGGNVTVVE